MDIVILTVVTGKILEYNSNIGGEMSDEELLQCFNFILQLFQQIGEIQEEALYFISLLSTLKTNAFD